MDRQGVLLIKFWKVAKSTTNSRFAEHPRNIRRDVAVQRASELLRRRSADDWNSRGRWLVHGYYPFSTSSPDHAGKCWATLHSHIYPICTVIQFQFSSIYGTVTKLKIAVDVDLWEAFELHCVEAKVLPVLVPWISALLSTFVLLLQDSYCICQDSIGVRNVGKNICFKYE